MDTQTMSWLFEKILDHWFWVLIILLNIFSKSNSEDSSESSEEPLIKTDSNDLSEEEPYPTDRRWDHDRFRNSSSDQLENSEYNEAVHTFRLNQAQADLTRGSNALIDAEHILKDLLKFPKKYDNFY